MNHQNLSFDLMSLHHDWVTNPVMFSRVRAEADSQESPLVAGSSDTQSIEA